MGWAAACLGLLPAAVSTGIGVQAQQPLARVVVGGMITLPLAILFLIPVLASYWVPPKDETTRRIVCAVNQPRDSRLHHGAGAHGARFYGHVKRRAEQAIIADALGCLA